MTTLPEKVPSTASFIQTSRLTWNSGKADLLLFNRLDTKAASAIVSEVFNA